MTPDGDTDPAPARPGDTAPLRILLLVKGLGPGGAERLLVSQAATRDREAFTYRAAYLVPWKDHLVPELEALGVPVRCLDSRREWDLRWALRLRGLVRRDGIAVVHVHSPYVAAVTRLVLRTLPRRRRPALVSTEHNRWPRHAAATRLANRLTLPLDDATVAVSADVRSTIEPARRRARVEVLVHGVDVAAVRAAGATPATRADVRAELGITDDEVVVGTVANLRREKGYDVLLDAAAHLARVAGPEGPPIRVVAVGQGPLLEAMQARVAELGVGDRVQLLGYRPDAVRVMAAFDLFTLASRHEGLPVALMDALVLGLPVVATRVGGVPEAVTDGVEGLLVPPDDPAALAAAWLALAGDPVRRAACGRAAADRAGAFDIRRATARLEAIYREVAARR